MAQQSRNSPSRLLQWGSRIAGILWIFGGTTRFLGIDLVQSQFSGWSLPTWFMYLVGTAEICAGLLILAPRVKSIGAVLFGLLMVGATWTHLAHEEWVQFAAVSVWLGIATSLAWGWRRDMVSILVDTLPQEGHG